VATRACVRVRVRVRVWMYGCVDIYICVYQVHTDAFLDRLRAHSPLDFTRYTLCYANMISSPISAYLLLLRYRVPVWAVLSVSSVCRVNPRYWGIDIKNKRCIVA